jgi:type IV secretory pathway VirB9-like protein
MKEMEMKKITWLIALLGAVSAMAHAGEPSEVKYKITVPSAPEFVPTKVYDDGKFTYIDLPKPYLAELPVVLALMDDGTRELVNFKWDVNNSRLVVLKLIDRVVLVSGAKSVVVSRT